MGRYSGDEQQQRIVFGLWHSPYGASSVLSTTASGLAYGLLAVSSRSLVPGVLAHGLYDSGWAVTVVLLQG